MTFVFMETSSQDYIPQNILLGRSYPNGTSALSNRLEGNMELFTSRT